MSVAPDYQKYIQIIRSSSYSYTALLEVYGLFNIGPLMDYNYRRNEPLSYSVPYLFRSGTSSIISILILFLFFFLLLGPPSSKKSMAPSFAIESWWDLTGYCS